MSGQLFSDKLRETARIMQMTGEMLMASMKYTHRNGETEPPTIYEQDYWFRCNNKKDPDDGPEDGLVYLSIKSDHSIYDHMGERYSLDNMTGQWWGPVTPPWEADA